MSRIGVISFSQSPYYLIIMVAFINMLDAITTVNGILNFGMVETNPLFRMLNRGEGYLYFILIKLLVSLLLLWVAKTSLSFYEEENFKMNVVVFVVWLITLVFYTSTVYNNVFFSLFF